MRKLSLLVLLLLPACAGGSAPRTPAEPRITVVAGFYPLFEAAERVGGDRVEVTNLTPPAAEPHDLELTTQQMDWIIDADVVLYLGGGFQPAVERALPSAQGVVVDLLRGIRLREPEELDHDHDEEDPTDELDPHVWLDPHNMVAIVDRVEAVLSDSDPGGRQAYADGASAFRDDLEELSEDYERGLSDCRRDLVVTSHASFGYLADRFGLRQEAISGLSPEAEPDPARMADLADLVSREGVTTVFTEALASPRVARTLAREAGVDVAVLDPLEGLSTADRTAGRSYVTVMRDNLDALVLALGCT